VTVNGVVVLLGESLVVPIPVLIDIKPGSDPNAINPFSRGVIPVALLGSDMIDVGEVDVTTLSFGLGPCGAPPAHDLTDPITYAKHLKHVNGDAFTDLVAHFRIQQTGIAIGDEQACLRGKIGGVPFKGCDAIVTQTAGGGCGLGFELTLLLPPLMWMRGRRRRRLA
jgi:hypothetical protein